jgi:hypothetical protein
MTIIQRWKGVKGIRLISSVFDLDRATRHERKEAMDYPFIFAKPMTFSTEREISRRFHHHITCYLHASFSKMKRDTRSVADVLRNDVLQYRSSGLVSFFVEA